MLIHRRKKVNRFGASREAGLTESLGLSMLSQAEFRPAIRERFALRHYFNPFSIIFLNSVTEVFTNALGPVIFTKIFPSLTSMIAPASA